MSALETMQAALLKAAQNALAARQAKEAETAAKVAAKAAKAPSRRRVMAKVAPPAAATPVSSAAAVSAPVTDPAALIYPAAGGARSRTPASAAFLDANPGLEAVLELDHRVLRDMAARLARYGTLSDKQIAFARKLAGEVNGSGAAQNVEPYVPAPVREGRQIVRGVLVSRKSYDGRFGTQVKCTIKVTTPTGVWFAWGTAPREVCRADIGSAVELTAELRAGRDAHFALMNRPADARVLASEAA